MDINDPLVVLNNNSKPTDKYEFKRVTISDKDRIKLKMKKLEEDATLLGPGRRPLKWYLGDKISEKLGLNLNRNIDKKPHIVQHYEMQTDIADNLTLKFTGKAGRTSALSQMKELQKKFEEAQKRIKKLRLYKNMAKENGLETSSMASLGLEGVDGEMDAEQIQQELEKEQAHLDEVL